MGSVIAVLALMLSAVSLYAQQTVSVTGKVIDEDGLPLEGVVVLLTGGR